MVCFCLKKTFRIIIKTLKRWLNLLFLRLDLYLTFSLWKREGGGRGGGGGGGRHSSGPAFTRYSLPFSHFAVQDVPTHLILQSYHTNTGPRICLSATNHASTLLPGREWPREKVIKWSSSQPEIKSLSSDSILEAFVWNPIATLHKALPSAGCFPGMLAFYCFAGDTFEVN